MTIINVVTIFFSTEVAKIYNVTILNFLLCSAVYVPCHKLSLSLSLSLSFSLPFSLSTNLNKFCRHSQNHISSPDFKHIREMPWKFAQAH